MLPSAKRKVILCATAFMGMVICSIYSLLMETSYSEKLIKIKYELFTKMNGTSSLNQDSQMTSTYSWRRPQTRGKPPLSPGLRSDLLQITTQLPTNTKSYEFMDTQANIQQYRRNLLKDGCSKCKSDTEHRVNVPSNIIVDEKYKLVYCFVPKVACTSWKRVFLVLNGVMNNTDDLKQSMVNNKIGPHELSFLKSYNASRRAEILDSFTKFLVVRHPFQRALSAYKNKLWAGSKSPSSIGFQMNIGLHILNKYRVNKENGTIESRMIATENKQRVKYDLRFDEFVKFLINKNDNASLLRNSHWREISELCRPCEIDYDIVSHFETLVDDARYILQLVHADRVVEFPSSKGSSPTNSSSKSVYESYYDAIPRADLEKLYQKYKLDFELFGYEKPANLL